MVPESIEINLIDDDFEDVKTAEDTSPTVTDLMMLT